ncbi:MAG TPA: C1 family peptidase [Acidimicrobiia bacterium]|nr:C1 family peptidase [Acidimicrobiia bacterium]
MASRPIDLEILATDVEKAGSPWQVGETSMTMLTEQERVLRLGVQPPPGEMSLQEAAAAFEHRLVAEVPPAASIGAPPSVDHRNLSGHNYTTSVKNQGNCGSCVAFGTAAVMETTFKRKNNVPTALIDLSEAHLFYCHGRAEGRNCANGWWPENALIKARDIGVTTEAHYPYTAGDQNCTGLDGGWSNDLAKVTGLTKLTSPAAMKDWIATHGSITGCFVVYQDFFAYTGGIYSHVSGAMAGGHCIEIIGYDDNQGCWIAKNSWGTGWGESGYFRIAYGQCAIETWAGPFGANGVTMKTWRNGVKVAGLWSNDANRNAWAYLSGVGWRRVIDDSDVASETMLAQLIAAKTSDTAVNVLDDQGELREIYA